MVVTVIQKKQEFQYIKVASPPIQFGTDAVAENLSPILKQASTTTEEIYVPNSNDGLLNFRKLCDMEISLYKIKRTCFKSRFNKFPVIGDVYI